MKRQMTELANSSLSLSGLIIEIIFILCFLLEAIFSIENKI